MTVKKKSTKRVKRTRHSTKAMRNIRSDKTITETPSIHPPISESDIPSPSTIPSPPSLKDSRLGPPLEGYEGKYWTTLPSDTTPSGFWRSGAGIDVPRTIHTPTGSKQSYIKITVILASGKRVEVWKVHEQL